MESKKREIGFHLMMILGLAVMVLLGILLWKDFGKPVVEYSIKTHKPVAIQTETGRVTVTPSTVLPEKYEKVWVP